MGLSRMRALPVIATGASLTRVQRAARNREAVPEFSTHSAAPTGARNAAWEPDHTTAGVSGGASVCKCVSACACV